MNADSPESESINIAPTWSALLPLMLDMIRRGGEPARVAANELARLARLVDEMNAKEGNR